MTPDTELLNRYATARDETAFAELVRRHLDHVYSTALRLVGGDAQFAEDVSQMVFTALARKAGSLRRHATLSGWLHTSARFAAAKVVRGEQRRRQRELSALTMPSTTTTSDSDWAQLRPVLDQAIGELNDADRDALLLRYFEKQPLAEVGVALGLSENSARMRVDRATEKLRTRLALRGITSTAAALGTALAQQAVSSAPAALAAPITSHALAVATASSVTALTAGKLALAAATMAALVGAGLLLWPKPPAAPASLAAAANGLDVSNQTPPRAASSEQRQTAPSAHTPAASHGPELFFVDDRTGRPITNQFVELKGWERGSHLLVRKQVPLVEARCVVPFDPKSGPDFRIYTHAVGYANAHLRWNPKQGDVIPDTYMLRLVRPALIHGFVVDTAGNPVAGATVGFNTEHIAAPDLSVEDHDVDYITTKTDAKGRWQFNCLAPEMVQRIYGGASHPDYAHSETIFVSRQPALVQQLLDGTLIFHLGEGITVRGTVVDQNHHPIRNAKVHVGMIGSSASRDTRTGADGSFHVGGCASGYGIVSAEAEGFAPAAIELTLTTNLQPVELALGPGKPLKMRVVDTSGAPVVGASLWLDSFPRHDRSWPIPQVEFRCKTDSEGRAEWTNTPDQRLAFTASAPGHIRRDSIQLQPGDQEQLITLQSALVIRGTVRDATTSELIPRFRLRIGWPEKQADGSVAPRWSSMEKFCQTFTGGQYRQVLDETAIGGQRKPEYMFRFEAEGHGPSISRIYKAAEGEVALDVQLQPAQVIGVVAYLPNGRAARDAQVGFMGPGSDARLVPGGFEGSLGNALAAVRRVDANGRFTFPDDPDIKSVVVACPAGYAEAKPETLRKTGAIRLTAWGRVEGVRLMDGQPITNSVIDLYLERRDASPRTPQYGSFQARTDATGHFVFPQVPPGRCSLWASWSHVEPRSTAKFIELDVQPGQTTEATLGEKAAAPQR